MRPSLSQGRGGPSIAGRPIFNEAQTADDQSTTVDGGTEGEASMTRRGLGSSLILLFSSAAAMAAALVRSSWQASLSRVYTRRSFDARQFWTSLCDTRFITLRTDGLTKVKRRRYIGRGWGQVLAYDDGVPVRAWLAPFTPPL